MAGIARSLARSGSEPDYVEVERTGGGMSRKHLRAYLGTIPAYGQDESVKGVKLQGAVKNGPAEKAGVINGDILTGLGDVDVENIQDFMSALAGLKAGEPTTLVTSLLDDKDNVLSGAYYVYVQRVGDRMGREGHGRP